MTTASYTVFRHTYTQPIEAALPQLIGNGLSGEAGVVASAQIQDHGQDAVDHLIPDYDQKPRIEWVLRACGAQCTQLEAQLIELQKMKSLDLATGIFVDILGAIVGEPRQGRSDALYKSYIRIRILVNRSKGKLGSLYAILSLAFSGATFSIYEYRSKAIDVQVLGDIDPVVPSDFVHYLLRAKPDGARLKFIYTYESAALTLVMGGTNVTGTVLGGINVTGSYAGGVLGK